MSYGGGAGGYPSVFTPPSYPNMETWQRPESSAPPMNEVLTHAQPTPGMNYSAPWQPNMGTHDTTPFDHTASRWPAPFTPEPPSYSHPPYPPPSYQQSSDHRQNEYQQGNYGYEVPYSPPVPSIPSNMYAAANRESEYGNAVTHRAAAGSYGNEQVVAYHGGSEPYGARGTGSGDYWESPAQTDSTAPVSSGTSNRNGGAVDSAALTSQGAQRYTVRLLPDNEATGAQKEMVCQIALDGVKLLEKGSSRVLRVYPLETITCWAVKEPSVFTFWARSAVDVELRAVRLQSSEYTTTSILDALTACCVQLFEMVGKDGQGAGGGMGSAAGGGGGEGGGGGKQLPLFEWMAAKAKIATQEEEKDHWVPDTAKNKCSGCQSEFNYVNRKHHCRNCGDIFCDKCSKGRSPLTAESGVLPVRVCDHCLAEVTQRLSQASVQTAGGGSKAGNLPPQRTHEDLAKKLQEEMERKGSSSFRRSSTSTQASLQSCGRCGTVAVTGTPGGKCAVCGYDASAKGGESTKSNMQQWGERGGGGGGVPTQAGAAMREVVCPTCTVHLHVQVPTSGMETVECGVCRQPFLVEA